MKDSNNNIIISILVPIYKVEEYLQRCIDSVLSQDFKDWEMVLVDDGSPDKCPQIADKAAAKDVRIHVVHKENGGLISARRAGVLQAKGKYYMFLDSDDWLAPNALTLLYNEIERGFDLVKGGAQRVLPNGQVLPLEHYEFEKGEINGTEDFLVKMYIGKVPPYLWGALYKAELFDEQVFNESIRQRISLGEDKVTNLIAGMKIRKVLYIQDIVYNYFYNPSSIMSSAKVSDSYGKRMEQFLYDRVFIHYPSLQVWQKAKKASYCFINCFRPDVGISNDFELYYPYINDIQLRDKIFNTTPHKYLRFIDHKYLFKLYSWIYRTAYMIIKGSNNNRRILE